MKESTNPLSVFSKQQQTELAMLHSVLSDDTSYLWNPCEPAAAAYLDRLEEASETDDLLEDAFQSQWDSVAKQAEQIWSTTTSDLATSLIQQFESRMPVHLLTQLAAKAQAVSNSGLALMDQLVDCAQAIVVGWEADDLQVMARPLAMAMRDGQGEAVDMTMRSVQQADWDSLSELEQARLVLAIARHALDEIAQEAKS